MDRADRDGRPRGDAVRAPQLRGVAENEAGDPFKDAFNSVQKYVASHNPAFQLKWPNSTLLQGDAPEPVARVKRQQDGDLLIMGSAVLIHSLVPHDLIDEYRLAIHPLVLSGGVSLFPDDDDARGRL